MRHLSIPQRLAASILSVASLMLTVAPARATWSTNPTLNNPVSVSPTRGIALHATAPDSCGGFIAAWLDGDASVSGLIQIDVQRMDAYGQPRWALNGFPITPPLSSTNPIRLGIASDGAGGAYVAWCDQVVATTGLDIFVQHVLAAGLVDPAWPAGGLPVCSATGNQTYPQIVADGAGGAVIAWKDERVNFELAPDIYAQRVSPTGGTWWTPDGAPVIQAAGDQSTFAMVADGSGGLYVAFEDNHTGNYHILTQHLDGASGARLWALGGVQTSTLPAGQRGPALAAAGGRLFVAWSDYQGSSVNIYTQAFGPGGVPQWAVNGAPVSVSSTSKTGAELVSDGLGGVIIGWKDSNITAGTLDHHVQRLDPSGNPVWAVNGLALVTPPTAQGEMRVTSDQRSGAIFVWGDYRNGGFINGTDLYAQRVSDTGLMLWGTGGTAIATAAPSDQSEPRIVSDGAGGAVIAWRDLGRLPGPDTDIYAQQVGASGLIGVRAPSRNCAPDLCGFAYTDFGDAPENAPVYPSGSFGHFPTCMTDTPPGTQEIACGAAPGTPPGPTGYVKHVATSNDQTYFGLGCGPPNAQRLAVDTEADGVVHVAGSAPAVIPSEVSTCSPAVTILAYESAFGGLWFGTDEAAGDGIDAGLAAPIVMGACNQVRVPFQAWNCGPASLTATLNILVDWNQDGDWNDVVACGPAGSGGACTPEWAVKNASVVLQPGCNSLDSPQFVAGPGTGGAWMRVTLTAAPVSDDFPWAGSATAANAGGAFAGGETEDYPVSIVTSSAVGSSASADQLQLAAVSPNPSRDGASVQYALPRAADVRLAVYDLAGRQVRVLAGGLQGAGMHAARWDGRNASGAEAPAGLYLVRLHVEGHDLTRTMVRLR
jgi:hypothetical protein